MCNDFSELELSFEKSTAIITLSRPKALNAINRKLMSELETVIDRLELDPEIMVIVITGSGEKAFCAGGDITEEMKLSPLEAFRWSEIGHRVFSKFEESSKVVIAAVNGYCLGGGFELALACDLRICVESAKFGAPESKLGICCGFGGNIRLPRIIGAGRAKELLLTGKMIDAQEAYRIGLVNRVVKHGDLKAAIDEMCAQLINKSSPTVNIIKKAVQYGEEMDFQSAKQYEIALFGVANSLFDRAEGMTAFLEKRDAVFRGR